jgi:hypothetical protein
VSCIVDNPIDMTTQVHVFVTGMNTGFQRFYLTRKPAATSEEAFATALREDYSITASRAFPPTSRAFDANEAVPMRDSRTRRTATTRPRAAAEAEAAPVDNERCSASVVASLVIARPSAASRPPCSMPSTLPTALSPPDSPKTETTSWRGAPYWTDGGAKFLGGGTSS